MSQEAQECRCQSRLAAQADAQDAEAAPHGQRLG